MLPCEICQSIVPLDPQAVCSADDEAQNRILIAEDDPLVGQDLQERLQSLGYQIAGLATTAHLAVSLATNASPDLVLMDIHLAGEVDGIAAAEQIRRLEIPVVFVTGCSSGAVLERAVQTEPFGYVLKPYETTELKVAIRVALRKHQAERERQRLVARLQHVLASVKTMSGRLSICAYCKRIKDGTGQWPEVEAYVMRHSNASFTHGMCPGCFERVKAQLQALQEGSPTSDSLVLG